MRRPRVGDKITLLKPVKGISEAKIMSITSAMNANNVRIVYYAVSIRLPDSYKYFIVTRDDFILDVEESTNHKAKALLKRRY